MSQVLPYSLRAIRLAVVTLLTACSGPSAFGPRPQRAYAQTTDSATSTCLRNPACYAQVGDDALLPWLSLYG